MALTKCTDCGNEVSDRAAACPRCGAPTSSPRAASATHVTVVNPGVAAVLSFFVPGAGQVYNGEFAKAVALMCALIFAATLAYLGINSNSPLAIAGILPAAVWFWGIVDAYVSSQKHDRDDHRTGLRDILGPLQGPTHAAAGWLRWYKSLEESPRAAHQMSLREVLGILVFGAGSESTNQNLPGSIKPNPESSSVGAPVLPTASVYRCALCTCESSRFDGLDAHLQYRHKINSSDCKQYVIPVYPDSVS